MPSQELRINGQSRQIEPVSFCPSAPLVHSLSTARLRPALLVTRPYLGASFGESQSSLPLTCAGEGRRVDLINNLAVIFAAIVLMVPFAFIPFSNTLPWLALLLFYANAFFSLMALPY